SQRGKIMAFRKFVRCATIRHRTSIALIIPLSPIPDRSLYFVVCGDTHPSQGYGDRVPYYYHRLR
ncbi:putative Tubulin-specific chaperone D, partial [Daphnia magna]